MGLDNYIVARKNNGETDEFEICYWRKCWNIRNWVFDIIQPDNRDEMYEFPLTLDNVVDIYYMFKKIKAKAWDNDGGSIWEYSEMKSCIKNDIKRLKCLIKDMKKDPELCVFFIDSY